MDLRSVIFSICSLVITFAARAQTLTVVENGTARPLEGVQVFSKSTGPVGSTDANGQVTILTDARSDTLVFTALGYRAEQLTWNELAQQGYRVVLVVAPFQLPEVVISANRWEQDRVRVPDRITVMGPEDVAFHNPGTTADLLQQSGQVFVQKNQQAGGSPMLRGFAANRVLIVVDGVRMNNAIYRAGNLQNVINVDVHAVEHAEVVYGPGAMTYGSDAIGGVMDFRLLRPGFSADSGLLVRGTSYLRSASAANEIAGHVDLGIGSRKFAFVGSASLTGYGDLRMGSDGLDDYLRPWYVRTFNGVDSQVVNVDPQLQMGTAFENYAYMAKLAYRPIDGLEVGLNGYYTTTSDHPRYDAMITARGDGSPRWAVWNYGPQAWRMISGEVSHIAKRGPWTKAHLVIASQRYDESRTQRGFRETEITLQKEQVDGLWLNLDLQKFLGKRVQLLYGAEAIHNLVGSHAAQHETVDDAYENINARYPDGSTWWTGSVYVGAMADLTQRLTLSAGARYSRCGLEATFDTTLFPYPTTHTELNNGALTGNIGAAWRPGTAWKLAVDLSTGFRSPNIDDVGKVFSNEPGTVIVPNPELGPEYAYNAEVSAEKTILDRVKLSGSLFYILVDDVMVRRPYDLNGADSIFYEGSMSRVDAIQNAAQARVWGGTFSMEAILFAGFSAEVRYTGQSGSEDADDGVSTVPLRHSPPSFGRIGLRWAHGRVDLRALFSFSDGFTTDELAPTEKDKPIYALDSAGEPYCPPWQVLDVKGSLRVTPVLLLTAGLENVLDARYRTYSSGMTSPGRNFIVALRATF
ncbi:MAG: TonB-dependent receptor [Flavobacteriales bacterium]|nr:TonB-dependent receptor [Flavobacteriales bacterium]MBP6696678.1 TonB-dependent receptor [Flavobacteriales bacterium]